MINSYFIKNINNEEVLYLNFDFSYEFSSFDFMAKREKIQEIVKNFIRDNKIVFKGATVLLVSGGVLFGSIVLNTPNFTGSPINSIKPIESSVTKDDFVTPNASIVLNNGDSVVIDNVKDEKEVKSDNVEQPKIDKVQVKENNSFKVEQKKQVNDVNTPKVEEKTQVQDVNTFNVDEKTQEVNVSEEIDNNIYVNVRRNGSVVKIELEEYVIGVVGAEMPASFSVEALKAQAVIARTYALKANSRGTILSDNESSQSYKSNDQLKSLWGGSYNTYYNKIKGAVDSTKGMYLTYNGSYIEAVYHSTSNGQTEDSSNVWGNSFPYLVSVDSPYDSSNPSFLKSVSFSFSEISKRLGVIVTSDTEFIINGRTSGNRVSSISVGEVSFTGIDFRSKLGLRSADFDIEKNDESVVITTRGYGHGVGMSQYGANGMAKAGSSYRDILFHYYPGVSLKLL
jgi:stage II sporulation protein D